MSPPAVPATVPENDRALGLALFEAEECLARGNPDKALVLASRAVKERPDSLTARALLDRARREMLRGRRRERLETRVQEASRKVEAGDLDGAERIVASALKLIPDHALALDLLARIKQQRLGGDTAEAEALRELERLAGLRAQKALEVARAALTAGREVQAFLALRQGLRHAPGDPELLALLREAQTTLERLDLDRARRHALTSQIRAGLDLLARGTIDESLRILRAVLRDDPDNARAQAAVQQVRKVWLTRVEFATATGGAGPAEAFASEPSLPPSVPTVPPVGPRREPPARTPLSASLDARRIPVELRLPATMRRATPIALVLACGAVIVAALGWVVFGGRSTRQPPAPPREALAETPPPTAERSDTASPPQPAVEASGPWSEGTPELRAAAESRLTVYARALETADPQLLAVARPDLSAQQRERVLAPFLQAVNAATDLRVVRVVARGSEAEVVVLRSDIIVDGPPVPPVEETLRFRRESGEWVLR